MRHHLNIQVNDLCLLTYNVMNKTLFQRLSKPISKSNEAVNLTKGQQRNTILKTCWNAEVHDNIWHIPNNVTTLMKVGRYPLMAVKLKCLSWICLCFLPCGEFMYWMLPSPINGLNNKNWLTTRMKNDDKII